MSRTWERLLRLLDRFLDFALSTPAPGRWQDEAELHYSICRHPAGKHLHAGDQA